MATHSSILAWKIPWTEEPGGLQSTGSESDITEHLTRSLSFQYKQRPLLHGNRLFQHLPSPQQRMTCSDDKVLC